MICKISETRGERGPLPSPVKYGKGNSVNSSCHRCLSQDTSQNTPDSLDISIYFLIISATCPKVFQSINSVTSILFLRMYLYSRRGRYILDAQFHWQGDRSRRNGVSRSVNMSTSKGEEHKHRIGSPTNFFLDKPLHHRRYDSNVCNLFSNEAHSCILTRIRSW